MQSQYWPLALYMVSAVMVVAATLGISAVLGERHADRSTDEPFECGMPPTGSPHREFPVSFYVMAVLFVIFDMETVLFVSWAVCARQAGWAGFLEIVIVSVLVLVALVYLWKRGALSWASSAVGDPVRDHCKGEGS